MQNQQYLDLEKELNEEVKISKYRLAAMIAQGYISGIMNADPSANTDDEELLKGAQL